jgi:hypothetical protein
MFGWWSFEWSCSSVTNYTKREGQLVDAIGFIDSEPLTNLLRQFRRLHFRLDNLQSDDLARRLHVCPHLPAMADGKATLAELVSRDIVDASRLSHDHRRRIGVNGHVFFVLLCSASDCFGVVWRQLGNVDVTM